MEATDRSISPTMTISSMGSAMMAISPMFRPVKKNVVPLRKVEDFVEPKTSDGDQDDDQPALPAEQAAPQWLSARVRRRV